MYVQVPSTAHHWEQIQREFHELWNFPQCLGAIDGKHVRIKCPPQSGSKFFNYKGYFSVVLFGISDARYRFIYHEVGAPGSTGDSTIWNNSEFRRRLESGNLNQPESVVSADGVTIPSLVVGDAAFALTPQLMKPFPERGLDDDKRIFNYRLCRARRVIENAFGIMSARFRVFAQTLQQSNHTATLITKACLALHNFFRTLNDGRYCGATFADRVDANGALVLGEWRQVDANLAGSQRNPGVFPIQAEGEDVRDALKRYFVSDGAVPWQRNSAYL